MYRGLSFALIAASVATALWDDSERIVVPIGVVNGVWAAISLGIWFVAIALRNCWVLRFHKNTMRTTISFVFWYLMYASLWLGSIVVFKESKDSAVIVMFVSMVLAFANLALHPRTLGKPMRRQLSASPVANWVVNILVGLAAKYGCYIARIVPGSYVDQHRADALERLLRYRWWKSEFVLLKEADFGEGPDRLPPGYKSRRRSVSWYRKGKGP